MIEVKGKEKSKKFKIKSSWLFYIFVAPFLVVIAFGVIQSVVSIQDYSNQGSTEQTGQVDLFKLIPESKIERDSNNIVDSLTASKAAEMLLQPHNSTLWDAFRRNEKFSANFSSKYVGSEISDGADPVVDIESVGLSETVGKGTQKIVVVANIFFTDSISNDKALVILTYNKGILDDYTLVYNN